MASVDTLNSWVKTHGLPGMAPLEVSTGGGGTVAVPPRPETFSSRFSVALPNPATLSPEMVMALIAYLQTDYSAVSVQTNYESIELAEAENEEMVRVLQQNADFIADRMREAARLSGGSSAAGWGGAIGGGVAAAVGGVAAIALGPIGWVIAAAAAIFAAVEIANMGLKQGDVQFTDLNGNRKVLDIGLGGMVDRIIQQQIKDGTIVVAETDGNGNRIEPQNVKPGAIVMTRDQIAVYQAVWTAAATLAAGGTMAGAGFAAAARFEKVLKAAMEAGTATKDFSMVASAANTIANAADTGGQIVTTAANVTVAAIGVGTAQCRSDEKEARARGDTLEAQMELIGQLIDLNKKAIQKALEIMNKSTLDAIKEFSDISQAARHAVKSVSV